MEFSWQSEGFASSQFMNMDGKWQIGCDASQSFYNIGCPHWPINVEQFRSPCMCNHEEDSREASYVVCMHMAKTDGPELAKTPAKRLPGNLCSFATIK
jgi:hypothetical protein